MSFNPKFKVGDKVTFINDDGVKFPERKIVRVKRKEWGLERDQSKEFLYYFEPNDAPWMYARERNFILDEDDEVLAEVGGHRIRHTAIPLGKKSDQLWFIVGLTGSMFSTLEGAIKFATENPVAELSDDNEAGLPGPLVLGVKYLK